MKTNEIVIQKVKTWLQENGKSHQWLADELGVSKALVGHMLSGKRTLHPKRIEEISNILGIPMKELVEDTSVQSERVTINLRGKTTNRRSKQEVEALLFMVEDYVGLKNG